jgi:sulfur-oxidizing protein SoxY
MTSETAMTRRRPFTLAALLAAACFAALPLTAGAQLKTADNPQANEVWQKVRASYFKGRTIEDASADTLTIDAPTRAEDAAIVPMTLRARVPAGSKAHVTKMYLIIDNNPSPIAGIFDFAPGNKQAEIETRVRVDEYTHARAIAELSDGRVLMATRFVKASGGCSAPPGKDPKAALASLGKMRLRIDGELKTGQPVTAQLMINHPNHSGLAMDQYTRQFTPAHFVRRVSITQGGQPVLLADLDFAISENPNLRFTFVPKGDGALKAEVVDSLDMRFESSLPLAVAP